MQKIKLALKTIISLLSGVVSVQQNFGKEWIDIDPETADYYSCFLFRNGRHIPVPLMLNIYSFPSIYIDGKMAWTKLNIQEVIIWIFGKIMALKKIRRFLDQMDQETIILALLVS